MALLYHKWLGSSEIGQIGNISWDDIWCGLVLLLILLFIIFVPAGRGAAETGRTGSSEAAWGREEARRGGSGCSSRIGKATAGGAEEERAGGAEAAGATEAAAAAAGGAPSTAAAAATTAARTDEGKKSCGAYVCCLCRVQFLKGCHFDINW